MLLLPKISGISGFYKGPLTFGSKLPLHGIGKYFSQIPKSAWYVEQFLIFLFQLFSITVMPAIIIPFIPFGIWELRIPVAWSVNYLVERFNGIDEGSLTPGRGYGSRGYISQGKKSS